MPTTEKIMIEMPRDVVRALDKLLEYTEHDEMKDYFGERPRGHIWLSIRRVLEWRTTLPGAANARAMLAEAKEWDDDTADNKAA
jgi:hypothetical protein